MLAHTHIFTLVFTYFSKLTTHFTLSCGILVSTFLHREHGDSGYTAQSTLTAESDAIPNKYG